MNEWLHLVPLTVEHLTCTQRCRWAGLIIVTAHDRFLKKLMWSEAPKTMRRCSECNIQPAEQNLNHKQPGSLCSHRAEKSNTLFKYIFNVWILRTSVVLELYLNLKTCSDCPRGLWPWLASVHTDENLLSVMFLRNSISVLTSDELYFSKQVPSVWCFYLWICFWMLL